MCTCYTAWPHHCHPVPRNLLALCPLPTPALFTHVLSYHCVLHPVGRCRYRKLVTAERNLQNRLIILSSQRRDILEFLNRIIDPCSNMDMQITVSKFLQFFDVCENIVHDHALQNYTEISLHCLTLLLFINITHTLNVCTLESAAFSPQCPTHWMSWCGFIGPWTRIIANSNKYRHWIRYRSEGMHAYDGLPTSMTWARLD